LAFSYFLARPVAELAAGVNQRRIITRFFERDQSIIATLENSGPFEERRRGIHIADEFPVREGIGEEVARGRVIGQQISTIESMAGTPSRDMPSLFLALLTFGPGFRFSDKDR
jgi:hypothetical protein